MPLWQKIEAAPEEPNLGTLQRILPSAGWPPGIDRKGSGAPSAPEAGVPSVLWESGYDHIPRPLARWALLWRLRIHPHLCILGALPEQVKGSLREWAWPAVSPPWWTCLSEQLRDADATLSNLLPLSPWMVPTRANPVVEPPVPSDTPRLWTVLDPPTVAAWARVRAHSHEQMTAAMKALWDTPAAAPTSPRRTT